MEEAGSKPKRTFEEHMKLGFKGSKRKFDDMTSMELWDTWKKTGNEEDRARYHKHRQWEGIAITDHWLKYKEHLRKKELEQRARMEIYRRDEEIPITWKGPMVNLGTPYEVMIGKARYCIGYKLRRNGLLDFRNTEIRYTPLAREQIFYHDKRFSVSFKSMDEELEDKERSVSWGLYLKKEEVPQECMDWIVDQKTGEFRKLKWFIHH